MNQGDLVLIPFPFTNLTGNKLRPALILAELGDDVTLAFTSSKLGWEGPDDVVIKPSETNGLRVESVIRIHKIATLHKDLIEGRLGSITKFQLETVKTGLRNVFDL